MSFIQQTINGLSIGSVYALIAIGYTMVYGIIGLINFAHGDIYMTGAFFGFLAATYLNLPFILVFIISMIGAGILGVIIEKVCYKPLRGSPKINLLITAIAMSLLLENGYRFIFGANPKTYPKTLLTQKTIHLGSLEMNQMYIIIIAISIILVVLLQIIVFKTKIGKAMRATSYDMDAAQLMGINVNGVISVTFFIGSALAGAAGILVGVLYNTAEPYMGMMPGLKAFIAAVLGGIGVIPGAMIGGIVMGLVETFTKAYVSTKLSDAIVFGILILVLLVKPSGILGKNVSEKV